jgi:hypothetical protein
MFEGQEFIPGPDVIGQPADHRRRPRPIPPPLQQVLPRFPQDPMGPQSVVLKQAKNHQRIPGHWYRCEPNFGTILWILVVRIRMIGFANRGEKAPGAPERAAYAAFRQNSGMRG